MKKVRVPLVGKEYDILIGKGLLHNIDTYINPDNEIVIISDDNIPKKYMNIIQPLLHNPLTLFIPEGETSKCMEMAQLLINQMIENGVTRQCTIIALGGGVVGDLAGFVASIYMRGVDFIQIPTTLLSQIDSSVGGKVGVNTPHMKNAIGSFKQPSLVLIDSTTLETLPQNQISSGIAEMIKYGLIASKPLFEDLLNKNIFENIDDYIFKCVTIKKDIVLEDEFDNGQRQILNYGHTIGHAIEQYSNYELLHGEAVSIGMIKMSVGMSYYHQLLEILNKYNLPTSYEYDKEVIYNYILTDKKATQAMLNIIIVENVGNGYIKPIEISQILEKL